MSMKVGAAMAEWACTRRDNLNFFVHDGEEAHGSSAGCSFCGENCNKICVTTKSVRNNVELDMARMKCSDDGAGCNNDVVGVYWCQALRWGAAVTE